MATSDEQFGPNPPYHPDMTTLTAADLLRLASHDAGRGVSRSCLDELELARLAEGKLEGAARSAAVEHLAGCEACRIQLAALTALLAEPTVAREVTALGHSPRRLGQRWLAAAGLAAVAATLVLVFVTRPEPSNDVMRDQIVSGTGAPVAIGPIGEVREVRTLTWRRVDGASSYRATLFDSTGTVLFELQLGDTAAAVPDSLQLVPRQTYYWRVEARTGWDRWSASQLIEFRIGARSGARGNRPNAASDAVTSFGSPLSRDSLRVLPERLSDDELAGAIRTGTVDVRDAFRAALAGATRGDSASRRAQVETARRLARAQQTAWQDDFLVRELARFTAWSPAERQARVWVDSVRVAGITVFGRDGPRYAIPVWRRAMSRAQTIPDSAGIAALSGNIGAALARESQHDSALRYLTQARTLAESAGDLRVAANAISELAGIAEEREDIAAARAYYARAIGLRRKIGDWRGLAADYNNIASLSRAAGEFVQARKQLEAALELNRQGGRVTAAATNLVNLASLAASVGAFGRAEEDYRAALSAWLAQGDSAEAASAWTGLGELNLRRGDYTAAVQSFTAASQILDRTGPIAEALMVRERLAAALAARGLLQPAVDELRRAQRLGESLHVAPVIRAGTSLAQADLALQFNWYPEAEMAYSSAQALYSRAGVPEGVAAARHGLGTLYLSQGNLDRAAAMLENALRAQTALRDGRSAALTRVALGSLATEAGDTALARRQLERAGSELDRLGDPVASAGVLTQRAELEAGSGRFAAAESLYRAALVRLGTRPAPEVSWRIHAGLGEARARLGAKEDAAKELRASITEIERAGASLRLPERRSGFLADKWDVYQRLAGLELERGKVPESFAVSEALRAREMLELLALGRIGSPRDTASDLIAREQDLRRRIGELSRAVDEVPSRPVTGRGPELLEASAVSREALLQAQASYTALLLEIRERAPRHAALVAPETVTWRMVAQKLKPDQAVLEYLLGEQESFVYVITRDTLSAIPLGVSRRDVARRVQFARAALPPRGPAVDSLWRAPLRQLHRDLIEPIEAGGLLAGKTRLTVIPHLELHYLPFAALVERDGPSRFLIQRYQLSFAPSASVWFALGNTTRRTGSGTLALAPHLDRLPASRQEIAALTGQRGGNARVLTGTEATEAALLREAGSRRLIHFATFGVLNQQNPLFSFVELASEGRHDGRLEVHEVFSLPLVADLVVLAACQTGLASGALGDVPAGDDWVGLSRAFLSAGANRVMASLWAVQDRATGTLMQRFYERYGAGADPAGTLAQAQRALLQRPETAHPYYWAGFAVVGGR